MVRTPLRPSTWLSNELGADVRLKIETVQPTGSYKIRGAFNVALTLQGARPALVTASAGNHGRALARAARECGMPLVVYASQHAPRVKVEAMRSEGAEVRFCRDYDEAERSAKACAVREQATFVSPYAHPAVIAGAGTVGLEILEDWPEVDTIVAAIGGGGLVSGIGLAASAAGRPVRVVGVEVEASSPFTASLAAGRIVEIEVSPTLADGLAGNLDPDTPTFDMVRMHVDRVVRVSELDLRSAVEALARHEALTVEGAGAAAAAAAIAKTFDASGRNVAVVVSGGNIDPEVLEEILSELGD